RYGRLNATDDEIYEAARQADAHPFILELPQGYETIVGDNGLRVSGGQRQRIALARAFLRRPELLVLDEATNALDCISEEWIQSALENLGNDCTVIIAAHRFSTLRRAGQVIVLDQGSVSEQGSAEHLLKRDGVFSQLYSLQSLSAFS